MDIHYFTLWQQQVIQMCAGSLLKILRVKILLTYLEIHHFIVQLGVVIWLFVRIIDVIDKNPADNSGKTPLYHAAFRGYLDISQLIIGNLNNKNPTDMEELFFTMPLQVVFWISAGLSQKMLKKKILRIILELLHFTVLQILVIQIFAG